MDHDGLEGRAVNKKIRQVAKVLQLLNMSSSALSALSLGPVYVFVCISFRTDNLNCFGVS